MTFGKYFHQYLFASIKTNSFMETTLAKLLLFQTANTPPARIKTFLSTFSTPPHYLCILTEMPTHYFITSIMESNICHAM